MVTLESAKIDHGLIAPDFSLISAVDNKKYTIYNIKGEKATLVMFICNHCPYVNQIIGSLVQQLRNFSREKLGIVAIMPNDTENYPEDSFDNMNVFAREKEFFFPYLFDKTQNVAKSYGAVCTPDFFVFNSELLLKYRGRFENNELSNAVKNIIATGECSFKQNSSIGCSIKWMCNGN